jgi:hypothetical protein
VSKDLLIINNIKKLNIIGRKRQKTENQPIQLNRYSNCTEKLPIPLTLNETEAENKSYEWSTMEIWKLPNYTTKNKAKPPNSQNTKQN